MREIKFRGISQEKGVWLYGWFDKRFNSLNDLSFRISENKTTCILEHYVDEESVGQFTGLKDKNGVDIYEGDICNSVYFKNSIVCFWESGWYFESSKDSHHSFRTAMHSIEVIGNIYENSELLK